MMWTLATHIVLVAALLQLYPADMGDVEAALGQEPMRRMPTISQIASVMRADEPAPHVGAIPPRKVEPASLGVVTSAVSALVVDRASGMVLYEKNSDASRSIGSISKLMTALVYLDGNPDLDAPAALQGSDIRWGGIQHVSVGDVVRARDLLHASLIGSDNSATAALVRLSGLSEGDFVARMNEKAAEIGMRATTFMDPTGLSADNRAVAADIVRLLDVSLANDDIRAATQLAEVSFAGESGRVYTIPSTDELLGTFLNEDPYRVVGGKTGYLPEAGYCLGTVVSENGGHEIAVVVLGSETKAGRFTDVKALAAWAFRVYEWADEPIADESAADVSTGV